MTKGLGAQNKILYFIFMIFIFRKPTASSKAMKLGGKSKDVDSFVDQLKSEGENVVLETSGSNRNVVKNVAPSFPSIKAEKLVLVFDFYSSSLQSFRIPSHKH